jgi:hypothetical protein
LLILDVVIGLGPAVFMALGGLARFATWWFVLPVWSRHQCRSDPVNPAGRDLGRERDQGDIRGRSLPIRVSEQTLTGHHLSRADARRIAVRAQLLDSARPTALPDLVRQLTLLQIDPTAVIAPSADLLAWSRLGSSYSQAELDTALEGRALLELRAVIRPSEDLALHRADMADWPGRGKLRDWQEAQLGWVRANDACHRDILDRLSSSGPLPSRDLPDTCQVPWASTGWTNNRNVTQLLEFMVRRGRSRWLAGGAATGYGTWRPASTPMTRWCPRIRRYASAKSGGCALWASPAPGDQSV